MHDRVDLLGTSGATLLGGGDRVHEHLRHDGPFALAREETLGVERLPEDDAAA